MSDNRRCVQLKKPNTSLATCASLVCLLVFSIALGSSVDIDFVGTISNISENIIFVNITESNETGLQGMVNVVLYQPSKTSVLEQFAERNTNLSFDIIGHNIDGILVCDVYHNGTLLLPTGPSCCGGG
jgi:hypothetical protein